MARAMRVFVIHVWTDASGFLARVRAADEAEPHDFDDPLDLMAFLRPGPTPPAGPAAGLAAAPDPSHREFP